MQVNGEGFEGTFSKFALYFCMREGMVGHLKKKDIHLEYPSFYGYLEVHYIGEILSGLGGFLDLHTQ